VPSWISRIMSGISPGPDYWLVRIDRDGHFEAGNMEWRPIKRHKRKRRSK
jgi:hypothetical protein